MLLIFIINNYNLIYMPNDFLINSQKEVAQKNEVLKEFKLFLH